MKSRIIVCALAAASLGISSLSFAQGYDRDRGDNNRQGYQQRDHDDRSQSGWDRRDRRDRPGMGDRADHRRDGRADHYYYGARGPEWRRGGHVPPQYRSNQYVVNDWRGHRLSAPARGYQWVQVGGDYVLIAIATGIIAQLLLTQ
jgi:Ni/Co efflux regulator RcnB